MKLRKLSTSGGRAEAGFRIPDFNDAYRGRSFRLDCPEFKRWIVFQLHFGCLFLCRKLKRQGARFGKKQNKFLFQFC